MPAEKGDARNLTNTSGAAERYPAWSPDGRFIAYFSDESGEYALHLRDQTGLGEVKKINLGNPPSFFYSPVWSPDSKKIAYTDKRLNLWYVDIDKGTPVKVDTNTYENPFRVMDPSWSPDSRWISYTKQLDNRLGAVFIYSLETSKTNQITDGMSDARFANFDKNGKAPLLHSQYRRWTNDRMARYVEFQSTYNSQCLCCRATQRFTFATRA